jgi:hypothetical protein
MILNQLLFLVLLTLYSNSMADEFFVFECGSTTVMFPSKTFPLGVPFTAKEVCYCSKRNWRGIECDIKFKNALLSNDTARKNNLIADKILGKEKFWRRKLL